MEGQEEIIPKINWWILLKQWMVTATSRCRAKKTCYGWRFWKGKNGRWTKAKRDRRRKAKKKELRWKIAAKNKEFKKIKKAEKENEDEKELSSRLKELNEHFAKMKEHTHTQIIIIIKRKRFACKLNIYFYHTYVCK